MSIFEYETGDFVTYTDYDLPVIDLVNMKFKGGVGRMDLGFASSAGNATWSNARNSTGGARPFVYDLYCPGVDSQGGGNFGFTIESNMQKKPVAYGSDTLKGVFTFYAQPNTHTYMQTGPLVNGSLTFKGVTEPISGTLGHIDRQWFPLYSGIFTPTGRQHSKLSHSKSHIASLTLAS